MTISRRKIACREAAEETAHKNRRFRAMKYPLLQAILAPNYNKTYIVLGIIGKLDSPATASRVMQHDSFESETNTAIFRLLFARKVSQTVNRSLHHLTIENLACIFLE